MILLNLWIAASLALGALWALGGLLLRRPRKTPRAKTRLTTAMLES
jgi:hypothetical protein